METDGKIISSPIWYCGWLAGWNNIFKHFSLLYAVQTSKSTPISEYCKQNQLNFPFSSSRERDQFLFFHFKFSLGLPLFLPSMMELPNQTTLFNSLTIYLMCSHYQGRITSPTDKISIRPPKLLKTDKRCARKRGRKILFPPWMHTLYMSLPPAESLNPPLPVACLHNLTYSSI